MTITVTPLSAVQPTMLDTLNPRICAVTYAPGAVNEDGRDRVLVTNSIASNSGRFLAWFLDHGWDPIESYGDRVDRDAYAAVLALACEHYGIDPSEAHRVKAWSIDAANVVTDYGRFDPAGPSDDTDTAQAQARYVDDLEAIINALTAQADYRGWHDQIEHAVTTEDYSDVFPADSIDLRALFPNHGVRTVDAVIDPRILLRMPIRFTHNGQPRIDAQDVARALAAYAEQNTGAIYGARLADSGIDVTPPTPVDVDRDYLERLVWRTTRGATAYGVETAHAAFAHSLGQALDMLAERYDWCREYESVMARLNPTLNVAIESDRITAERDYLVEVSGWVRVPFTTSVRVTAASEDAASEAVSADDLPDTDDIVRYYSEHGVDLYSVSLEDWSVESVEEDD